jgi:hypothetical protein
MNSLLITFFLITGTAFCAYLSSRAILCAIEANGAFTGKIAPCAKNRTIESESKSTR